MPSYRPFISHKKNQDVARVSCYIHAECCANISLIRSLCHNSSPPIVVSRHLRSSGLGGSIGLCLETSPLSVLHALFSVQLVDATV